MTTAHAHQPTKDKTHTASGWQRSCVCGWRTDWQATAAEARAAVLEHVLNSGGNPASVPVLEGRGCPAWCVAHDPAPKAPALHLSRPVTGIDGEPYAYRWDRPDAPAMISVHLPEHDMTPQQALLLAAQLVEVATAALSDGQQP